MTFLRSCTAAAALALATLGSAHAQVFSTTMTGPAEQPPNTSTATGTASLTFEGGVMRVQADFTGLTAGVTAAHVHCCTAEPFAGTIPPATALPSFPGFPAGTSGVFDATFDLADPATWNPAFLTANGGIEGAPSAFLAGLSAGRAYFNIHTSTFPGGEIRGFLQAGTVAPIPEPSTYALMLAGLALVGWAARRRAG